MNTCVARQAIGQYITIFLPRHINYHNCSKAKEKNLATPIECLDLDDKDDQLKLEGWLYIFVIFIRFLMRRHHFIGNLEEEPPFYWLFERGGTILLSKFWSRMAEFFYLCPKLCWRLA